jgi:hypothetical protein
MNYKLSNHAEKRIKKRGIDEEIIQLIVDNPDSIIRETRCKHIYQQMIKEYLHRVFVNVCKQPHVIITVYKTSKVKKYER